MTQRLLPQVLTFWLLKPVTGPAGLKCWQLQAVIQLRKRQKNDFYFTAFCCFFSPNSRCETFVSQVSSVMLKDARSRNLTSVLGSRERFKHPNFSNIYYCGRYWCSSLWPVAQAVRSLSGLGVTDAELYFTLLFTWSHWVLIERTQRFSHLQPGKTISILCFQVFNLFFYHLKLLFF